MHYVQNTLKSHSNGHAKTIKIPYRVYTTVFTIYKRGQALPHGKGVNIPHTMNTNLQSVSMFTKKRTSTYTPYGAATAECKV